MSEKRKKIRKAILKLLSGRTLAKDNVFANRSIVNAQEKLPGINVYFTSESLDEFSEAPRKMKRLINCQIEVLADGKNDEEVSDKLDDILEQIEHCLSSDDTLLCTASDTILKSVEIEIEADGERPIGSATQVWEIKYFDDFPRDTKNQGIVPLKGYDVDWQIGHHDSGPTMAETESADDKVDF